MSHRRTFRKPKDRSRLRNRLYEAQHGECVHCYRLMLRDKANHLSPYYATFQHIIPYTITRSMNQKNIVLAHACCNEGHGCKLVVLFMDIF